MGKFFHTPPRPAHRAGRERFLAPLRAQLAHKQQVTREALGTPAIALAIGKHLDSQKATAMALTVKGAVSEWLQCARDARNNAARASLKRSERVQASLPDTVWTRIGSINLRILVAAYVEAVNNRMFQECGPPEGWLIPSFIRSNINAPILRYGMLAKQLERFVGGGLLEELSSLDRVYNELRTLA